MGVSDQLNRAVEKSTLLLEGVKRAPVNFGLASALLAGGLSGVVQAQDQVDEDVYLSGDHALKAPLLQDHVFRVDYPLSPSAFSAFECYENSEPNVEIETYYVVDAQTGDVLMDHGGDKLIDPASMTKLMTALIAYEAIEGGLDPDALFFVSDSEAAVEDRDFDDKILFTEEVRQKFGKYMPAKDAVIASVVGSYNDAAFLVAENVAKHYGVGNSELAFVGLMNKKIDSLVKGNTRFFGANGMPIHYYRSSYSRSSWDSYGATTRGMVATIREIDNKFPELMDIMSQTSARIKVGRGNMTISSSNSLVKRVGELPFDDVSGKSGATCNTGLAATMRFDQDDKSIYISYVGGRSWYDREQRMTMIAQASFDKIDENRAIRAAYAQAENCSAQIMAGPEMAFSCAYEGAEIKDEIGPLYDSEPDVEPDLEPGPN